jgi:hypothetical protein
MFHLFHWAQLRLRHCARKRRLRALPILLGYTLERLRRSVERFPRVS